MMKTKYFQSGATTAHWNDFTWTWLGAILISSGFFVHNTHITIEKPFHCNTFNPELLRLKRKGWAEKKGDSVCQWVNSPPHLEHIVWDLAGLSCAVSLTISAVPMRMGEGIDCGAKGVDSQQPGPWLMHWWTDEITLWVIFVSCPPPLKKTQSLCRAGATVFLLKAPGFPGPSLILEFLSPYPAAHVPSVRLIYWDSFLQ